MREIATLVHQIKLNEFGWWEICVQNIIISVLGSQNNSPHSESDIINKVVQELEGNIDRTKIKKQFEVLRSKGKVISYGEELYQLKADIFDDFLNVFSEQKTIELSVEEIFLSICVSFNFPDNANELWSDFKANMLFPLIKEIGAKTYELVTGKKSINIEDYKLFHQYVQKYKDQKVVVVGIISEFMKLHDTNVRKYLLVLLNEYFFIEAMGLDSDSVEKIYALSKTQQNLKLFIDTNFLLTLLDLHENPSNEATKDLLALLEEIKNKVKVTLYLLPITISEFQNLIYKFIDYIKILRPTLDVAAIVDDSSEISGILKRYFQVCNKQKRMIPAEEYFNPYVNNFTVLLRAKGIVQYNEDLSRYSTDQRVIDDLEIQTAYRYGRSSEKIRNGKNTNNGDDELLKTRIYDKFTHDCKLWHIVRDLRPGYLDSPKDAIHWIITLDFSFLEYDRFKQSNDDLKVAICLHPNELISLLQFWVPRSTLYENAILGNLRLPFMFKDLEPESEKLSIAILSTISHFEEHQSLPKEVIAEMLTNTFLRQKISINPNNDENIELIKEEMVRILANKAAELEFAKVKNNSLAGKVESLSETVSKMHDVLYNELSKILLANQRKTIEHRKELLTKELDSRKKLMKFLVETKVRIDDEIERVSDSFIFKIKTALGNKREKLEELRKIHYSKNPNLSEIEGLGAGISELEKELHELSTIKFEEKIYVLCENKNEHLYNKLNLPNIVFTAQRDSGSVFIKIRNCIELYGLRDRDFLTDSEVEKLLKKFPNFRILEYYCIENYLYHPDNLAELKLEGFSIEDYIADIVNQKTKKIDQIISIYKNSRNSYEELKIDSDKIKDKIDTGIIENLRSNDIDVFLKSYSMKDHYNLGFISKFQISQEQLASTIWFKNRIINVLKGLITEIVTIR